MSKTVAKLKRLLSLGENQTIKYIESDELKYCGPQVCAFLNTKGGYLLCGIDDKGQIKGIANATQAAEQLESQLKSSIQPPVLFSVDLQEVENKQLLIIEVPAGKDIPYAFNSDIYTLIDEQVQKADIDTIRDMVMRKQIEPTRWERLFSSELNEQDLSVSACKKLLSAKRIPKEILQSEQGLLHQLQLLSLAKYGRLTNAADVLLASYPGKRHPQARVRAVCYRHKAVDEYQDLQHFDGPMFTVIEQIITFVMRNTPLRAHFRKGNNQREELPMYPEQAVREAIVNAFAHRDYSSFSGGVKVEISPVQLKVWNSGAFPQGIDELKIEQGHISVLRNPDIAHILYLKGYMEKLGRGSVVIQEACKKAGLPSPKWHSDNMSGVTLTLFATEVTTEVTTEVIKMVGLMSQEHSRDELMKLMGLKNAEHFRKHYLKPALGITPALVEMTIPEKPTSSLQKYRLTPLGLQVRQQLNDKRI